MSYAIIKKVPNYKVSGKNNNKEIFYKVEINTRHRIYEIVQQDKDLLFACVKSALRLWNPEVEDKIKEVFESLTEADGQKRIPRTGAIAVFVEKIKCEIDITCNHIVKSRRKAEKIIRRARLVGDYSMYEIKKVKETEKVESQAEYIATIGNYFGTIETPTTDDIEEFIELIRWNHLEAEVHPELLQKIKEYASAHRFVPYTKNFRRYGLRVQVKHLPRIVING